MELIRSKKTRAHREGNFFSQNERFRAKNASFIITGLGFREHIFGVCSASLSRVQCKYSAVIYLVESSEKRVCAGKRRKAIAPHFILNRQTKIHGFGPTQFVPSIFKKAAFCIAYPRLPCARRSDRVRDANIASLRSIIIYSVQCPAPT